MNLAVPTPISRSTSPPSRHLPTRRALRPLGWLVIIGAVSVAGCGGGEPEDTETVWQPRLPSHVAEPAPGCPFPQLVPEGNAWMTGQVDTDATGALIIHSCADNNSEHWGGRHFRVRDVFVDAWKVTEGCYAACVQAGACQTQKWPKWDEPGIYPALLPSYAAEQYCAWRGGRLPTGLELVRASHGDVKHITNPSLWDKTVACHEVNTPECKTLVNHAYGLQSPVGSVPEDVGPFGHHDLFGNSSEMTSSYTDIDTGGFCEMPADAYEPALSGGEERRVFFTGGEDALFDFPRKVSSLNYTVYHNPGDAEYRCAYDPMYVEE